MTACCRHVGGGAIDIATGSASGSDGRCRRRAGGASGHCRRRAGGGAVDVVGGDTVHVVILGVAGLVAIAVVVLVEGLVAVDMSSVVTHHCHPRGGDVGSRRHRLDDDGGGSSVVVLVVRRSWGCRGDGGCDNWGCRLPECVWTVA